MIEGYISKDRFADWFKSVIAVVSLTAIMGSVVLLWLQKPPVYVATYPTIWKLVLASIKAGVVEEIYTRLILVSLFVWFGGKLSRGQNGRPMHLVYWVAIVLSGLLFGWEHVEDRLSHPEIDSIILIKIMIVNTAFGIIFGWQFWKLGLECAMLSHFALDAMVSAIVLPAYLSDDLLAWIGVGSGMLILAGVSLRLLMHSE